MHDKVILSSFGPILYLFHKFYKKMKKVFLLSLLTVFAFSCNKNPNNPVTPQSQNLPSQPGQPTTQFDAHFIPNWFNNDTLYGYVVDANGLPTSEHDTIFTKTVNDTSYIIHRNKQYYIWTVEWFGNDSFKADQQSYNNIVINDRLDTINAIIYDVIATVLPHKYKDERGNWTFQNQLLLLNTNPKYSIFTGYQGHYQAKHRKP